MGREGRARHRALAQACPPPPSQPGRGQRSGPGDRSVLSGSHCTPAVGRAPRGRKRPRCHRNVGGFRPVGGCEGCRDPLRPTRLLLLVLLRHRRTRKEKGENKTQGGRGSWVWARAEHDGSRGPRESECAPESGGFALASCSALVRGSRRTPGPVLLLPCLLPAAGRVLPEHSGSQGPASWGPAHAGDLAGSLSFFPTAEVPSRDRDI